MNGLRRVFKKKTNKQVIAQPVEFKFLQLALLWRAISNCWQKKTKRD